MQFKQYSEAERFLEEREAMLGMDFGLSRMETILKELGNPEKDLSFIHLAGSNGKGSTLAYLKEIFMAEGLTAASFTSPHIERLNERIKINDRDIKDQEILDLMNELMKALKSCGEQDHATHFEILTLLSIMHFAKQKPDIVLFETGLGGRTDATNVIRPLLSIITNISLEHTAILGDTLGKIAFEKAGIIKEGVPVIIGKLAEEARSVMIKKARECHADLVEAGRDFTPEAIRSNQEHQVFDFMAGESRWKQLELSMLGRHQVENASLACAAVWLLSQKGSFQISSQAVRIGLKNTSWKGRIEVLSRNPLVILDGAHNPDGMRVLIKTLAENFPGRKPKFLMAVLRDKDYKSMLSIAEEKVEDFVFTEISMKRSLSAEELYSASRRSSIQHFKDWKQAVERSLENLKQDEALVVTGSLYLISESRGYLRERLL
ncbi:bifunctional folylpolyglutamate synthase/dihydrofolate synthase [Peribacillus kribbensis]|uniref:bifunctional folylpolyglutamate synthase/dihydrofolate synthase n=1 Tax=Peribacillus kribbensis TaxID=356658 RepID=UPI0004197D4B|nr:folylpolyglutamate synthase/dihydrofolate synthase family protein [Peribacillus kribbensis]